MAKKRRDKKRDPSTGQRLAKIGKAALTVGVGAALLSKTNFSKDLNDYAFAIKESLEGYNKDLLNKKHTAMNIHNAFKKNIGFKGQGIQESLIKQRTKKIDLDTDTRKSLLGKFKDINQTLNSRTFEAARESFQKEIEMRTVTELAEKYKNKYSSNAVNQVVRSAVAERKTIEAQGEIGLGFIEGTLKKYKMSEEDAKDIIKYTLEKAKALDNRPAVMGYLKQHEDLAKEIADRQIKNLKKDTRDNLILNKIGKAFGIDNLEEKLLGSRAATYKEVKEFMEKESFSQSPDDLGMLPLKNKTSNKNIKTNPWYQIGEHNADKSMDDVIFDKRIRIKTNKQGEQELFSMAESAKMFDDFMTKFNSSIVGKVLTKGIDVKGIKEGPSVAFFYQGTKAFASSFDEDSINNIITQDKVYIDGELFNKILGEDGKFHLSKDPIAKGWINPHAHGSLSGVEKRMLGSDRLEPLASDNPILKKLDINQDGRSNLMKRVVQFFTKFDDPDWERNVLSRVQDRVLSGRSASEEISHIMNTMNVGRIDAMRIIHEDNKLIGDLFSRKAASNVLDNESLNALVTALDNLDLSEASEGTIKHIEKSKKLLELLIDGDTKKTFEYLTQDNVIVRNEGLKKLVNNYVYNTDELLHSVHIETELSKTLPLIELELSETNISDIGGIVRTNVLKEVFGDNTTWNAIGESISKGDLILDGHQTNSLLTMFHWSKFEEATSLNKSFDRSIMSLLKDGGVFDLYQDDMAQSDVMKMTMGSILEDMKKDYGLLHKGAIKNANEHYYSEYNRYEFIQKSNWGMDLIRNINDATKWKAALSEFIGGRNRPGDVTGVTLGLQYMVNRLSYGVEDLGLGLSSKSLSSPLASIMNIMTKRVVPAMLAYTAFDYLNDLSQDLTGTGITGAGANSVRNLDLLGRNIAYHTGVGQALDWLKQTSVIGEYWTGTTDFQTVEERKEWYMNGYSPMRKSRFWSFGSASEYRGGNITFYQPNYWRRIHSDYHDKWLYGGNKEKWKHSIIPTPTHPLSTIRYLMDPYWLERKHIDDAPTPLTGKMFSEGSFWGAILNPTIGEAIKPQTMLAENRRRLAGKGSVDSRSLIQRINERIKNKKGVTNDDLLVVNGTDIRNATYVPYGQPTPNELILRNGRAYGLNYMQGLSDLREYQAPVYDPGGYYSDNVGSTYGTSAPLTGYTPGIHGTTGSRIGDRIAQGLTEVTNEFYKNNKGLGQSIINEINKMIKREGGSQSRYIDASSPDSTYEGTYTYNNMVNEYNTYVSDYYEEKYTAPLINKSIASDHLADVKHSVKNLSGIYGFVGEKAFGENSYTFRYENAGSYQSFSSRFWDANIGGFGGDFMEIARRFFPSEDRSRVNYNPLKNNLPEWLPDYLRIGNPASKLTKHDMRLPGKGYESLNELHPDEYATDGYGAFDRFKILADVAPNSQEYKIWHNIVKNQTVLVHPELKEEMREIESRTKRMRGSHEFYEYQYLRTGTHYETDIVKEVLKDGRVLLANNQILTMAGIEFNENYNDELHQILKPGQKIHYRVENTPDFDENKGVVRNAAVYIGNQNINKQLMDMGVADRKATDTSSIGQLATVSEKQEVAGAIQELIAHARIPFIHNKLMHIETAREAFESEQINGANFQTWDHPIESFVKPMMNEVMRQGMLRRAAAVAYKDFHFDKVLTSNRSKLTKFASGAVMATLDPAALLFGGINWARNLNNGRVGSNTQRLGSFSRGAKFGSTVGTIAWGFANADNPVKATISFAVAGLDIYNKYEVADFVYRKWGKKIDGKYAAAVSAAIGLGVSALKNQRFDKDKMFGKWQPKKFKKMNELNEYFDRLEYIKYKGLYEAATRKAALFEKANLKETFKQIDKNKERIHELQMESRKLLKKYNENDPRYKSRIAKINEEINAIKERGNNMFIGGKYTKSAVAYKKAMESTIYGLGPGATQDEILASVPDQYKDYFQAFMEEKDPEERKKILRELPDYLKRPLQAAWGEEMSEVKSNRKYFKSHKLPSVGWRGWKPNINLKHVKMKTIENEGMLLSDFGFYESEKAKASYEMAPDIDNWDQRAIGISMSARLGAELKGMGVSTSNISLEKTSTPGFWMTADIKQSIEDRWDYGTNSVHNAISSLTANFL